MDLRLIARLIVVLAVGALVAWMAALVLTVSAGSVTATVVLRTLLVVAILTLLTRIVMRGAYDEPGMLIRVAVAAVLAYAISPTSWTGRTLLAQVVLDPGPATVAIDLVLWVGVVVVAARTADLRVGTPEPAPYQLG